MEKLICVKILDNSDLRMLALGLTVELPSGTGGLNSTTIIRSFIDFIPMDLGIALCHKSKGNDPDRTRFVEKKKTRIFYRCM